MTTTKATDVEMATTDVDVVDGAPPEMSFRERSGNVAPGVARSVSAKAKKFQGLPLAKQVCLAAVCFIIFAGAVIVPGAVLVGLYGSNDGDNVLCENKTPHWMIYYGWWVLSLGLFLILWIPCVTFCLAKGESNPVLLCLACPASCGLCGVSVFILYVYVMFNIAVWDTVPRSEEVLKAQLAAGEHLHGCDSDLWNVCKNFLIATYCMMGINCCWSCIKQAFCGGGNDD